MAVFLPLVMVAYVSTAVGQVPNFDIAPTCRADLTSREACIRDEQDAKKKLQKEWDQFTRAQRQSCVDLSVLGGDPSYVELLTCLEMAKQAADLPPQDTLNDVKR